MATGLRALTQETHLRRHAGADFIDWPVPACAGPPLLAASFFEDTSSVIVGVSRDEWEGNPLGAKFRRAQPCAGTGSITV